MLVVRQLSVCKPSLGVLVRQPSWMRLEACLRVWEDTVSPVELTIHSIEVDDVSVDLRRLVHVECLPLAGCFDVCDVFLELGNVISNRPLTKIIKKSEIVLTYICHCTVSRLEVLLVASFFFYTVPLASLRRRCAGPILK